MKAAHTAAFCVFGADPTGPAADLEGGNPKGSVSKKYAKVI